MLLYRHLSLPSSLTLRTTICNCKLDVRVFFRQFLAISSIYPILDDDTVAIDTEKNHTPAKCCQMLLKNNRRVIHEDVSILQSLYS